MIDFAAYADADAIKFQTFVTDKLLSPDAELITYQKKEVEGKNQYQMLKDCELSHRDFVDLSRRCASRGIDFLSTPFDEESADFLDPLVRLFKIPSGEITNLPLIEKIALKRKPIILSTGMADMDEISTAVRLIMKIQRKTGVKSLFKNKLTVLHCTSSYPCSYKDVNLNAMATLRRTLGVPVGYSDHSIGIEVAIAAAALGAEVIEKHFTIDRALPGPDQRSSLLPDELARMTVSIRNIEKALGDGIKKPTHEERRTSRGARKSIVAARDIDIGHKIVREDICIKRPGTGLPPAMLEKTIGSVALRFLKKDSPIKSSQIRMQHSR